MGMDAMINGRDVRFSKLLAEVAFNLIPTSKVMANTKGYVEFDKGQVASIIVAMSERIDNIKINEALLQAETPMDRVQRLVMNLGKLYSLMDWCQDPKNDNNLLVFA